MPRKRSKSPKNRSRSKRAKSKAKPRSKSKNRKYGGDPLREPAQKQLNVPKYGSVVDISHWIQNNPQTKAPEYFNPTIITKTFSPDIMNAYPTYMESNIDKRFVYVEWREGPVNNWRYRSTANVPEITTGSGMHKIAAPEEVGWDLNYGICIFNNAILNTDIFIVSYSTDKPCIKVYIKRNDESVLSAKVYFKNSQYYVFIFDMYSDKTGDYTPFLWYSYVYDSKEEMLKVIGAFIQNPQIKIKMKEKKEEEDEKNQLNAKK